MEDGMNILLEPLSFSAIMHYYAMISLTLTPLTLIALIILARHTAILDRVDRIVDKIVPDGPDAGNEKTSATGAETTVEAANNKGNDLLSGVAVFQIRVGETYRCRLNFQNRGGSYGGMVWFNDNEFVGKIDPDGLFKSAKAGQSNIFCVSKEHSYDTGIQAYAIQVMPTDSDWFVDRVIKDITERIPRCDYVVRNIKRKILSEKPDRRIIRYAGLPKEGSSSLTVQFDELDTLLRCAIQFGKNDKTRQTITDNLNERFEEIKLKDGLETRIWIHRIIDRERDEVDIYAVFTEQKDGLYLCIGHNWREYGEKEEFIENIRLAARQFEPLTGTPSKNDIEAERDAPETVGIISNSEPIRTAPDPVEEATTAPGEDETDSDGTYGSDEPEPMDEGEVDFQESEDLSHFEDYYENG